MNKKLRIQSGCSGIRDGSNCEEKKSWRDLFLTSNDCWKKREILTDSSVLGTELVTDIPLKSEGYFNCLHQGCNTNLTKNHSNSYPIPSMYVMDGIFTD